MCKRLWEVTQGLPVSPDLLSVQPDVICVGQHLFQSQFGFLDSSGISVLVKGRRLADGRGVPYRVTGASGTIRQVLDITGVWGHLSGQAG